MNFRTLIFVFAFSCCTLSQAAELPSVADVPMATTESAMDAMPMAVKALLKYALDQTGVAYRRGGTSPESGFDCSGFVRNVFDKVVGLALPHSSRALNTVGSRIPLTDLRPGDLVFFRFMSHAVSHVGIYIGNNRFIHASSTETGSVMVSDLGDSYWSRHFTSARRLEIEAK